MSEKDGGPAFPVISAKYDEPCEFGMSLRDYFAAHALVGQLSAGDRALNTFAKEAAKQDKFPGDWMAEVAYMHADAMLKARGS